MDKSIKQENKVWKIVKIVLNVIFYLIIAALILFSIGNMQMKKTTSIPNLFGYGYYSIGSNSMNGDEKDSFNTEDLVFVKVVNDKNRESIVSKLEVGDIITFEGIVNKNFFETEGSGVELITHRIVKIFTSEDGKKMFITQGDAVPEEKKYADKENGIFNADTSETHSADDILAVYTGQWKNAGKALKPNNFLLLAVIPTGIFFVYEAFVLYLNFTKLKQKKIDDAKAEEKVQSEAELKEQLRAQILAEMESKKNNELVDNSKEDQK